MSSRLLALESGETVGSIRAEVPNLSLPQSPKREVPARIPRPDYAESGDYLVKYIVHMYVSICSTG